MMSQIFLETRIFRLSDGEEIMTLAFFVFIQYRSVTNRWTDGQTDGQRDGHLCSGYTSACIARYANALKPTQVGLFLKNGFFWTLSVSLSVCLPSYCRNSRSILMKLCIVVWNPKSKIEFVGGQNPTTPSPIFPEPKFSACNCRRITEKVVNGFWRNFATFGSGDNYHIYHLIK